jgi:hypothetical protein
VCIVVKPAKITKNFILDLQIKMNVRTSNTGSYHGVSHTDTNGSYHGVSHTDTNVNLFIKKSTLPHAGLGLFSNTHFNKGDFMDEYKGKKLFKEEAENLSNKTYVMEVEKDTCYIDAIDPHSCMCRYANDLRPIDRKKYAYKYNARFYHDEKQNKIVLFAWKPIYPGQEIFVSYGSNYWSK